MYLSRNEINRTLVLGSLEPSGFIELRFLKPSGLIEIEKLKMAKSV